jgi:3-deoxy-D-manno-octulosonic acid kinase
MSESIHLKLSPSFFDSQDSQYFEPSYWQKKGAITGQEKGRGTTWFIRHNDRELVLRHYYRGGFMARFNRDRYLFTSLHSTRAFKEYELLQKLYALKLPVPQAAGARIIREGKYYRADLLSGKINKANDLVQILQTKPTEKLIQNIAHCIARFHNAGVYHPDLNIQNILIDDTEKVWLIDFDQAELSEQGEIKPKRLNEMMSRLQRSFAKETERHGIVWQGSDWNILISNYQHALASLRTQD